MSRQSIYTVQLMATIVVRYFIDRFVWNHVERFPFDHLLSQARLDFFAVVVVWTRRPIAALPFATNLASAWS